MYKCPTCDKLLSNQSRLNYHILEKVCCKPDKTCPKCNKVFSSKRNCQQHIKQKVCERQKPRPKLILKSKYDNMSREDLIIKLSQIEGKYESLKENPQNVNINNNNNIIVFPNAFGKEDIKYVQQKLGDIVGPLIKNHTFASIPCLFDKIHNNQQMPEYHNVYSTSERSSYALISDGTSFKYRPKKTIIDQIIESKRSILNDYVDNNGDQLGEKVLKKYEKYQERIDDDTEFRKNLELEIGGMLLDMKSVIANDEKTRQLLEKVNEGHFELHETIN